MDKSRSRFTTTKNDLARQMSQDCGISIKVAEKAIDSMIDGIKRSVAAGYRVEFRKFGVFKRRHVPARSGRMLRGRLIDLPPAERLVFKTAHELRSINAVR